MNDDEKADRDLAEYMAGYTEGLDDGCVASEADLRKAWSEGFAAGVADANARLIGRLQIEIAGAERVHAFASAIARGEEPPKCQ